jgi:uncharacterized damage-inducible protein DinB
MEIDEYRSLLTHMEWADATVWNVIRGSDDARSDGRIRELLHHLMSVQWVYLQVWTGKPLGVPEAGTFADAAALIGWSRSYYTELREFVETLTPETCVAPLQFPWTDRIVERYGSADPATLGESALQVVLHTTHHRAQVATRLRELSAAAPVVDFIAWVWQRRPPPPW